ELERPIRNAPLGRPGRTRVPNRATKLGSCSASHPSWPAQTAFYGVSSHEGSELLDVPRPRIALHSREVSGREVKGHAAARGALGKVLREQANVFRPLTQRGQAESKRKTTCRFQTAQFHAVGSGRSTC